VTAPNSLILGGQGRNRTADTRIFSLGPFPFHCVSGCCEPQQFVVKPDQTRLHSQASDTSMLLSVSLQCVAECVAGKYDFTRETVNGQRTDRKDF